MLKEKRAKDIQEILAKYPPERKRSAVMPLLYLAQEEYGYCSDDAMREVAEIIGCDPTEVKSIVGFYTMFYEQPVGKYVIDVCDDLPCALRGADKFVTHCEQAGHPRRPDHARRQVHPQHGDVHRRVRPRAGGPD